MKNKFKSLPKAVRVLLRIAVIIVVVALILSIAGPYIVLAIARQPEPEQNFYYSESFYTNYEDVRAHLGEIVEELESHGITVEHSTHAISESDGLYIDNIYIPALNEQKNLIVLTTGVHGIEGYIGAVMLDVFFNEIYFQLDMSCTGVLVVANVNPYGMKYMRRYNENNVDLNRNFIEDWESFDLSSNKEYPKVSTFLQPEGKIGNAVTKFIDMQKLFDIAMPILREDPLFFICHNEHCNSCHWSRLLYTDKEIDMTKYRENYCTDETCEVCVI